MEVGALGWVRCRLVISQNKFKLREVNKCEVNAHLRKHFPIELLVCTQVDKRYIRNSPFTFVVESGNTLNIKIYQMKYL